MATSDGSESSKLSNSAKVAETVWKFINDPVVVIFSDLNNPMAKHTLRSLLDSIIRGSTNLINVLIPPNGSNHDLQRQYTAFTTWLFGAMFYIVVSPLSKEVLSNSIEIQACMLRTLSRHHITMLNSITSEYMTILEEILHFGNGESEIDEIQIAKFQAESGVIDGLNLAPFPVVIRRENIPSVQISIMKIILKSTVAVWEQTTLWNKALKILVNAVPEVKIVALEVATHMINFCDMQEDDINCLNGYAIEFVKTIPTWKNLGFLKVESLQQCSERLLQLIEAQNVSQGTTELCLEIIDLIARRKITEFKSLESAACLNIGKYLFKNPRSCLPSEIERFLCYFESCTVFSNVLVHFIFHDIKIFASCDENMVVASNASDLWKSLKHSFVSNVQQQKFNETLRILKLTRLLDSWLVQNDIRVQLFDGELETAIESCLIRTDIADRAHATLLFENATYIMAHKEAQTARLQEILALPWERDCALSIETDTNLKTISKMLDTAVKVKCIEALCEFGRGKWRLELLRMCVINGEEEVAIASIRKSIFLLKDDDIKLEDFIECILRSVLISQKRKLYEALANVFGWIVCLVSKCAIITRKSWSSTEWTLECHYCDKLIDSGSYNVCYLPARLEDLLTPCLNLLASDFVKVRLCMSKNFLRFSNHMRSFSGDDTAKMWLSYIHDENCEIRQNFCKVFGVILRNKIELVYPTIPIYSTDNISAYFAEFTNILVNVMMETLTDALTTSNHSLHKTLLVVAKELACASLHSVERQALIVFLITILHPNSTSAATAFAIVSFQEIAAFHKVFPKVMYARYKKHFMKTMMKMCASNYLDYSYNVATSIHRFAKCIGCLGSRHLLCKDGHHAVCFLLPLVIEEPKVEFLLSDMADLMSMDVKQMFVEYFQYICPHIFLNETAEMGAKCFQLIFKITGLNNPDLMKRSFPVIFHELLLHFHEDTERIIELVEIMSKHDPEYKGRFDTRENVAVYLKPRLHGILVHLDVNLNPRFDEYTQQSALASLAALMRFMGPEYLTPLRYKVLATLRASLSFVRPGFRRLACDAWDAFIHNVSVKELGPLLPTICVSLVPLLESYPKESNAMLEFLISENNGIISNKIQELFFIDDIKMETKISDIVNRHIEQARPIDVEENVELWLKRIKHETDEVRFKALVHLQKFLKEHRSELNEMILSDTGVHPLIIELLDTLLAGCQDKDEAIRLAYGECLGELGAVEPNLLPRRIVSRDDSNFISDVNEEFACAVLGEFVRAFQAQKDTQSMDCVSLAIQEILKTYSISPQGTNSFLWEKLPSTMQQMICPFLTSHYKIMTNDDIQFPHPIYGSEAGSTFDNWAFHWMCSMSRSVSDKTLANVLYACRPAFKRDTKTLIFCIPYIVSHIVANGTADEQVKIVDEMLAVINVSEQAVVDQELLTRRPLRHQFDARPSETRISDEARRVRCSQVIFVTLDHLHRWLRERRLSRDSKYEAIRRFCEQLNSLVLAEGCYQSHEYHRALIYLEQHMASTNKGLSELTEGGLLAKIYAQLEEPDGVSGILATQDQPPTLQQLVLAHEVSGQLQDAATCYERLAQEKVFKPKYLQGMVQCYLGLDQPFTAVNITEGVLNRRPELEPLMVEHEPFWRLAHFARLDDATQKTMKRSLLDDLKRGLKPNLQNVKKRLVSLIGAASHQGAYQQSYSHIMKLHILNEFEKVTSIMLENIENVPMILEEWEKRAQIVRASRGVESVLSMRRAALDLAVQLQLETFNTENATLTQEIGKIWLKSAKIARKAGLYQQAYMYLLSAGGSCPPQDLYVEQAQFYWQKGCQEEAFTTLKRCFSTCFQPAAHYKQMPSGICLEERKQCAKAKLLFAKYNDETLNVDTDVNIDNYKEAIEVWRAWEKSLLFCAQYYESVVDRMPDEERDTKGRDLQIHMMNFYGKSLQYGCKYVHQSIPRMLTIWLDFASRMQSCSGPSKSRLDSLMKLTKIMDAYLNKLPTFMWLTAFSQLVSRICHPAREVQNLLCTILVKLISAYPQHCLWMMASVVKSSYPMRQRRCQEILNQGKLKTFEMTKLIQDFNRLWERLIELSNKSIPEGVLNTTVTSLSKNLPRLLATSDFSEIMIPTTKFRQLHLPSKGDSIENHNPFPTQCVHISGIEDSVSVMISLQRPRRIALKGSDGKSYLFMCKPKDDLRRDFRLMEFNDIVNKYLQKDPESRRRRLYIRTYSVVPLNEECGLIEWVPNLLGFRPIVMGLYKERGMALSGRELKTMICGLKDPLEKKRQVFTIKLLPRHPPVLGDWFRLMFPDPYGWYEARTAYIRTTAVMSMVGYILGLGDRHGENILFDSKNGDCVHVDFNCLFNRGELFDWPERVPFRLTHNMVEAMGPLKCEGPFRRSCQTTMRVLRQQATTLLSVLTPFVYDPLVSWNKHQTESGEKTNEKAVEHIKNIEQRLKGLIRSQGKKLENFALNLSVEGQTNHLILEATNVDNLCQMYFGWGPYL